MRPWINALLLALAALALSVGPALACSCVHFGSAREHVRETDLIFIGVVEESQRALFEDDAVYTQFRVVEVLKGRAPRYIRIRHNDDTCCICGLVFDRGAREMIFAHADEDGRYTTSSCSMPRFSEAEYRRALRPVYE
jgi:hypothetical protein